MYPLFRSFLFHLDPETAHALTLRLIRLAGLLPPVRTLLRLWFRAPARPVQAFGLTFANPVGLAAGYDKDALGWRGLACLGFGHIEVGTVTPRPQPGNPKPRLFRLVEQRGVINRMGFPGRGADFAARQLQGYHLPAPGDLVPPRSSGSQPPSPRPEGPRTEGPRPQGPRPQGPRPQGPRLYGYQPQGPRPEGPVLGVNIGKNKDTPLDGAAQDYLSLARTFAPLAGYLAVNVSSPNTEGLRRLQARDSLQALLSALAAQRQQDAPQLGRHVPILVKLAPDLDDSELDDALQAILDTGMDGVIATNTTVRRENVPARWSAEAGGLSGAPLRALSTGMVRKIANRVAGKLPIVGVGGIYNARDAREKLDAGACLVQIYTGLIYEGPGLVKRILREL